MGEVGVGTGIGFGIGFGIGIEVGIGIGIEEKNVLSLNFAASAATTTLGLKGRQT